MFELRYKDIALSEKSSQGKVLQALVSSQEITCHLQSTKEKK